MTGLSWPQGIQFAQGAPSMRTPGITGANVRFVRLVNETEKGLEFGRLLAVTHRKDAKSKTLQIVPVKDCPAVISELLLVGAQALFDGSNNRGRALASTFVASCAMSHVAENVKVLMASKAQIAIAFDVTRSLPATMATPVLVTKITKDKDGKITKRSCVQSKTKTERKSTWIVPLASLFASAQVLSASCIIAHKYSPVDVTETQPTETQETVAMDLTGIV